MNNQEFTKIYRFFQPYVLKIAYNNTNNIHDAEDICQDVFIAFYMNIEEIRNRKKWFNGTLRIMLKAFYRSVDIYNRIVNSAARNVSYYVEDEFKEIRIILDDVFIYVNNFFDEKGRALFELVSMRHLSISKAASHLGMTKKQGKYMYRKILNRLYLYLREKGIMCLQDII